MEDVNIREMREEDCTVVSCVVSESFRKGAQQNGFSKAEIQEYVVNRGTKQAMLEHLHEYQCFVACSDGNIVGMVAVKGNEITKLYVAPDNFRMGIGTNLFHNAEEMITLSGHSELMVGCHFDSSIAFYEAMGMVSVGRRSVVLGPMQGRDPMILRKTLAKNSGAEPDSSINLRPAGPASDD